MAKKKAASGEATAPAATKKKAATKKATKKAAGANVAGYFQGMEPITIEELESAAERYEVIKERRMALTQQEVEAKEELQVAMEKHAKAKTPGMDKTVDGLPRYHARGIHRIVELEQAGGLAVKVKKEPKPPKAEE